MRLYIFKLSSMIFIPFFLAKSSHCTGIIHVSVFCRISWVQMQVLNKTRTNTELMWGLFYNSLYSFAFTIKCLSSHNKTLI